MTDLLSDLPIQFMIPLALLEIGLVWVARVLWKKWKAAQNPPPNGRPLEPEKDVPTPRKKGMFRIFKTA